MTELRLGPWIPARLGGLLGSWRRSRGLYDGLTESLLRRASQGRSSPEALLAYLRFRRDLGHLPTEPQTRLLLGMLRRFRGTRKRQAINLLLECGLAQQVAVSTTAGQLSRLAPSSPAIAHALGDGASSSEHLRCLAKLHRSQDRWRGQFASHLREQRGSLCVVGNAGALVNAGLGATIDRHNSVTRFNRYRSTDARSTSAADTGSRIDIWVRVQDLSDFDPGAGSVAPWAVLTGPDTRYRMPDWQGIVALLQAGAKVLTIPLSVWQSLVARLEAPPSSGVLYLAWIIEILGGAEGLTVAGFQRPEFVSSVREREPYHQALPGHRASSRHHWMAEKVLLAEWEREGLVFLGSPAS